MAISSSEAVWTGLDGRLTRFRKEPGAEDPGELASALLAAGRPMDALEVTGESGTVELPEVQRDTLQGRAFLALGELRRAQAALVKAGRTAPEDPEPFRWLGEVLLKRGDPMRAVRVLSRAHALDPADPVVVRLSERARRLARVADAIAPDEPWDPESAASMNPDRADGEATSSGPETDLDAQGHTRSGPPGPGDTWRYGLSDRPETSRVVQRPQRETHDEHFFEEKALELADDARDEAGDDLDVDIAAANDDLAQEAETFELSTRDGADTDPDPMVHAQSFPDGPDGVAAESSQPPSPATGEVPAHPKSVPARSDVRGSRVLWIAGTAALAVGLAAAGWYGWKAWLTSASGLDEAEVPSRGQASAERGRKVPASAQRGADAVSRMLATARRAHERGDHESVREALVRAENIASTPGHRARIARTAKELGETKRARRVADRVLEAGAKAPKLRRWVASVQLEQHDGASAWAALEPLSSDDAESVRLRAQAALVAADRKLVREAAQHMVRYVAEHGTVAPTLRALHARLRARLGDPAAVLPGAVDLARQHPDHDAVALALGEVALAAGDPRTAIETLRPLVRAGSGDANAYDVLGRAYRMTGNADRARELFARALDRDATHPRARVHLARLHLAAGAYDEAETRLETHMDADVAPGARIAYARALVGQKRLDEARRQLEKVEHGAHERASYRIARAELALAGGNAEKAAGHLRPVATQDDAGKELVALFGDSLSAAGKMADANTQYGRVLQRDPRHPEALLGRTRMLVRAEKHEAAMDYIGRARKAFDERLHTPRERAELKMLAGRVQLYQQSGSKERARTLLTEATSGDDVPPQAWFFLGEAFAGHDSPKARKAYERYLKLDPDGTYVQRAQRAL